MSQIRGPLQTAATPAIFDTNAAERFANLALACVHKEHPSKISHSLNSDADVAAPRKLTPRVLWLLRLALFGARTLAARTASPSFPQCRFCSVCTRSPAAKPDHPEHRRRSSVPPSGGRASFERPYGLAWLLQLVAELREWDDTEAREMAANLRPLEQAALERLNDWLPKLSYPVRIGEHAQTAFALGLMLELCTRLWQHEIC